MNGDEVRDGRRGVFYMHDDVYDLWASEIGVYGVAVYGLLCRRADSDATCYPSLKGSAKLLGISKSKLVTTLNMLEAKRFISRTKRRTKTDGYASTLYTVHEPPYLVHTEDKGIPQQGLPLSSGRTGRNTQSKEDTSKDRKGPVKVEDKLKQLRESYADEDT